METKLLIAFIILIDIAMFGTIFESFVHPNSPPIKPVIQPAKREVPSVAYEIEDLTKRMQYNYPSMQARYVRPYHHRLISDHTDWAFKFVTKDLEIQPEFSKECLKPVTVAVVDTGVDYNHVDLKDYFFFAPILHSIGYDFVTKQPYPYDTHGHGTHVSGIVTSLSRHGYGANNGCDDVRILSFKYYDNSGLGYNNLTNTILSLQAAIKNGAELISYSGGGLDPSVREEEEVRTAQKFGIGFVAAAGNEGQDNMVSPYYPASYPGAEVVSVAAVYEDGKLIHSSDYGKNVLFGAPGLTVLSTLPENHWGTMSGTSQATPFVTAAIAHLVMRSGRQLTPQQAVKVLCQTAKSDPVILCGVIDLAAAARWVDEHYPPVKH
jgi:major intracellular serine protease